MNVEILLPIETVEKRLYNSNEKYLLDNLMRLQSTNFQRKSERNRSILRLRARELFFD